MANNPEVGTKVFLMPVRNSLQIYRISPFILYYIYKPL